MRSLLLVTLAATAACVSSAIIADENKNNEKDSVGIDSVSAKNLDESPVITQAFVDELNAKPGMTWKAALPKGQHAGITHRDFGRLLGVRPETEEDKRLRASFPVRKFTEEELATEIPDEFDLLKEFPQCKTMPRIADQSHCGSCWAVAAAGTMSDRYCTSGMNDDLSISAGDLLSCGWGLGCKGGNPLLAWMYWQIAGLVSEECEPYPFAPCGRNGKFPPCPSDPYPTPKCPTECTNENGTFTKYYGNSVYIIGGEEAYQLDLMANGPIEVGFLVYEDFLTYSSGVYQHVSGDFKGGHAVRLLGWGVTEDGVKYWKVANSWNTEWGMDGFFLIKRGTNECNFEGAGTAGLPRAP